MENKKKYTKGLTILCGMQHTLMNGARIHIDLK